MALTIQPSPVRDLVTNGDFSQGATGWTLSSFASVVGGQLRITGNTTVNGSEATEYVPVTPNTTYEVSAEVGGTNPTFDVFAHNNSTGPSLASLLTSTAKVTKQVITTPPNCYVIRIKLSRHSTAAGTATFDDITLRKVQPSSPTRNLVPLFNDAAWMKHANATASPDGKTLTLNATGTFQFSWVQLVVAPNTLYTVSFNGNGYMGVFDTSFVPLPGLDYALAGTRTFNTGNRTTVRVVVSNSGVGAGTFTFSNLTLTKALPTFAPAKAREFFAELVVNGGFNAGATGWTLSDGGSVVGGKAQIAGNTGAYGSNVAQDITVLPNTTYRIENTVEGTGGLLHLRLYGTSLGTYLGFVDATNGKTFTTPPNCYLIRLACLRNITTAGTATFDNISLKRKAP